MESSIAAPNELSRSLKSRHVSMITFGGIIGAGLFVFGAGFAVFARGTILKVARATVAAATRGLEGSELAELALMRDAGAKAVATGRGWIADSGVMLRLLRYCAMLGLVVVTHAEDAGITGSAVATAGDVATRLGLPSAPAEAEALAVIAAHTA